MRLVMIATERGAVMSDYERACREAAEAQGLGLVGDLLGRAGVPVVVEQTGGFVMVAYVDRPDGWRLGITRPDGWQPGDADPWVVGYYDPDGEGDDYGYADDDADLVTIVTAWRAGGHQ